MVPVADDYVEFVERLVKMNRDLTVNWTKAASTLTGAACKQVESASSLVREQAAMAGR